MLYKLVYEELKITCVTNDMLEQCSQKDDTDDGWKLIYLIRRLLWRFAYASKRFALQITETCYINYLLSDLRNLTETPFSTWNVINQFLIFLKTGILLIYFNYIHQKCFVLISKDSSCVVTAL